MSENNENIEVKPIITETNSTEVAPEAVTPVAEPVVEPVVEAAPVAPVAEPVVEAAPVEAPAPVIQPIITAPVEAPVAPVAAAAAAPVVDAKAAAKEAEAKAKADAKAAAKEAKAKAAAEKKAAKKASKEQAVKDKNAAKAVEAQAKIDACPKEYKPVTTAGYFWRYFVSAIPVIGFIYTIIMAILPKNKNLKCFMRAVLVYQIIALILAVIGLIIFTVTTGASMSGVAHAFKYFIEELATA